MKTSLTKVLQRLQGISDLANAEADDITHVYGGGGPVLEVTAEAATMVFEPAPCDAALRAFFDALPNSYVAALVVLMYAGRDEEKNPLVYSKHLTHVYKHREEAITALCEKSPRMEYLSKGIEFLGREHVDALPGKLGVKDEP